MSLAKFPSPLCPTNTFLRTEKKHQIEALVVLLVKSIVAIDEPRVRFAANCDDPGSLHQAGPARCSPRIKDSTDTVHTACRYGLLTSTEEGAVRKHCTLESVELIGFQFLNSREPFIIVVSGGEVGWQMVVAMAS